MVLDTRFLRNKKKGRRRRRGGRNYRLDKVERRGEIVDQIPENERDGAAKAKLCTYPSRNNLSTEVRVLFGHLFVCTTKFFIPSL